MLKKQTSELEARHQKFVEAIEEKLNIENIRQEFTNLRRLDSIEKKLTQLASSSVTSDNVHKEISSIQKDLNELKSELEDINKNTKVHTKSSGGFSFFGSRNND